MIECRLAATGFASPDATADQASTVFDLFLLFAEEIVGRGRRRMD